MSARPDAGGPIPDCRRQREAGGCYFFIINLLERRCNTADGANRPSAPSGATRSLRRRFVIAEALRPAVSIRKSVTPDYLVGLERMARS
jgi:hypothetical protein